MITENTRHLTASMVVVDPRARHVLLIFHKASGLWMFPGGHVDPDESPAEAAVREVHEETGIHARPRPKVAAPDLPGLIGHVSPWMTAEFPAPAKPERPGKPAEVAHSHIDLLYVGTADMNSPVTPAYSEVDGVRWVPLTLAGFRDLKTRSEVEPVALAVWFDIFQGGDDEQL